jgi:hypothetical protein
MFRCLSEGETMQAKMNWLGLAGGIAVLVLIVISFFVPWWQLLAGDNLVTANVSPIYTYFDFAGNSFTIPLLFAVNISCILLLAVGGTIILLYSARPAASYSRTLLKFSFWLPLVGVILFVLGLVLITLVAKSLWGVDIPLLGSAKVTLPSSVTQGTTVSVLLTAGFQWPFVLALAAAVLCFWARFYDKNIIPSQTV